MLITDLHTIGDRLYAIRKRLGMTQAQVAEAAELSDLPKKEKDTALRILSVFLQSTR